MVTPNTQPCKICNGSGTVTCPNQQCAHWCECTVCDGTGKVQIVEDMSRGHLVEKVRPYGEVEEAHVPYENRAERIKRLIDELNADVPPECEAVKLGKPVVKIKREGGKTCRRKTRK